MNPCRLRLTVHRSSELKCARRVFRVPATFFVFDPKVLPANADKRCERSEFVRSSRAMSEPTNPSTIAREVLRLLSTRRIAPTPDNYRQLYQRIAGHPEATPAPETVGDSPRRADHRKETREPGKAYRRFRIQPGAARQPAAKPGEIVVGDVAGRGA